MKQFTLRAWSKSVTPWSLQCESLGMSRTSAHAMFSTQLNTNHHPKQAAAAAGGLWITLIPLYFVAFTGFCFRKAFYFGFYTSRLVLLVCLSMIIHHLSFTLVIVNNATRQSEQFGLSQTNNCGDQYSLLDKEKIDKNLAVCWYRCFSSLLMCVVVLCITLNEVLCSVCCI